MAGIIVKPRARIFHGHDWVYASDIQKTFGNPEPGEVISLKDFKDRPLGSAIYNPNSQIVARRISRRKQELNLDFFRRRIRMAADYRALRSPNQDLHRLVWSEADGLPGVVIDRYGSYAVVQTLTLAMDLRVDMICEALLSELPGIKAVLLRNDAPIRKAEGLEEDVRWIHGDTPAPFEVRDHNGLAFEVNLDTGQKTGLYLDQLASYQDVAAFCKGRRVLDVFCNQGGFGLAAARAGAAEVTCVDVSEEALANTRRNAEINGVSDLIRTEEHNAFNFLKNCSDQYDLIILDPPSFTRNRKSLKDAMRGYKEIHLRALKLLDKGGILSTFCCSHHVTKQEYLTNVIEASVDAKRTVRLLQTHGQPVDHPVLPALPETEYLKGYSFDLIPAR